MMGALRYLGVLQQEVVPEMVQSAKQKLIVDKIAQAQLKVAELPERETALETKSLRSTHELITAIYSIDEVIRRYNAVLHKSQGNMPGKISIRFYCRKSKNIETRRPAACVWRQMSGGYKKAFEIPKPVNLSEMRVKSLKRGAPNFENDKATEAALKKLEALLELRRGAVTELVQRIKSDAMIFRRINERLAFHEKGLAAIEKRVVYDWTDPVNAKNEINEKIAHRKSHRVRQRK